MGTRGAWGFRLNNEDKLTYNHWDSYPGGLGVEVIKAIQKHDDEQLAGAATRMTLVASGDKPSATDRRRYAPIADLTVSERSLHDWYCLLRGGQGDITAHVNGTYDHMAGGNDFLAGSLFCEWAYIINMDTRELEVYKGFNKNPDAPGRYASLGDVGDYRGVALLATVSLDAIRSVDADELAATWESNDEDDDE